MTRLANQVKIMIGAAVTRHAIGKTAAITTYQFARWFFQEAELALSPTDRLRLGMGVKPLT